MKKFTQITLAALLAAPVTLGSLSYSLPASAATATPVPAAPKATLTVQTPAAKPAAVYTESAADFAQFLQAKYGIQLPKQTTKGDFIQAIAAITEASSTADASDKDAAQAPAFSDLKPGDAAYDAAVALFHNGVLTGTEVHAQDQLSIYTAVFLAVKAAGFKELAYTYPADKTAKALAKAGIKPNRLQGQAGQELAAAIDTGLVPESLYPALVKGGATSKDAANILLGRVLISQGKYINEIGRSNDADIYSKLYAAYRTADLIEAPELRKIVDQALREDLVTGYNLKDSRFDSNFIDELTLTYGHDSINHAVQLIGLLRSEGIDADVQFQPKTSAFIYLKEWGEPKETPDYKVTQIENGNYIAYAKEYDIQFEFNNTADKARFNDIVLNYAKKNSSSTSPLIINSWWQPLYYSPTALANFPVITNNKITLGHYYAQSFSLKENAKAIQDGFRKLAPEAKITSYNFWVDQPFFNYLNGGSE
ncbi:hypothetical protein KQI74_22420 [Paenibacillus barcinonensis]|uniref:hypothetical protein n=1 Tax=Paenibacillus barcinonensis TaxID=198119 RepID=UPI001C1169CF|nr:hypothetical protein [Paenibacillus barcinonensis]MBU5355044.1 hypothetical protein [Paenibacillus barcinonensis]